MDDINYMTKSDSEKEFEYHQSDLEKLLNLTLKKVDKREAGADYFTTDNKFGIELSMVAFKDIKGEIEKLEENEFKYIKDNEIIYADKIANVIDQNLKKVLIISSINNKNKIKNKIEKEMLHYSKSKSKFKYALIVLNCKYFMYESLFSDCKDVLRDIGLSYKSLIGVVIIYLKNTTDDNRLSLTPNVLIKNPHCKYQPFQITETPETDLKTIKPTTIHFEMSKDIISFDMYELIDKIKKFMIKNNYWDKNINITQHGFGSNRQIKKITLNNKEIRNKKFENVLSQYSEEEAQCFASIFEAIATNDILSFPQLSYYTGCVPSMLRKGLHVLIDDKGLVKSEKDKKLQQEFYTLSEKGLELKKDPISFRS